MTQDSLHWSDAAFKSVNLSAMGATVQGGSFHPLLKVRYLARETDRRSGLQ